jgi:hypothetical protein
MTWRQRPPVGFEERTQPNKELSAQAGRALLSIDRAPDEDIKNNAGSTREIGAAFQPEGGIFFRNLSQIESRQMRWARFMPQCSTALRLFFPRLLP